MQVIAPAGTSHIVDGITGVTAHSSHPLFRSGLGFYAEAVLSFSATFIGEKNPAVPIVGSSVKCLHTAKLVRYEYLLSGKVCLKGLVGP